MEASVQRLTMLVTPDGRWVFPDSEEFLTALGDPAPDYDAISFAVKNLGFIKLQIIGQSIIEIELHPRNVEFPALLAAQQQLLSRRIKLFRIRFFDTSWRSEISSSAESTIARLSELCAPVFTPPQTDRFLTESRDFSTLFNDEDNPLRPLAQKWRVSFGHFDSSIISLAVRHQFLSRLMIIGVKRASPDPVWRFIGDAHHWIGGQYQVLGIGEKVENMPDKEYGGWVAEFYKSVAASGEPRYDHVSAMLQYENENGKPRRLVRYERLLLPWKTPSDELFLTMCSKVLDTTTLSDSSSVDSSVVRNSLRSA
jgi:hypothetical protein